MNPDADATQDPSQSPRRLKAARPLTIRQLVTRTEIKEVLTRNGSEHQYSLNDEEFHIATFVGNIISVEAPSETTRTIRIEDGTGKITSTIRVDKETEDPPRWSEGAYARVFGVPRKFNEAVVFEVFFIRLVEDPHEVFFHLMEAMVVTLQYSRGTPPPRLHGSQFAKAMSPLPPSQRPLFATTSIPQGDNDPDEDWRDSAAVEPPNSTTEDTSDDGGSTEYYTDQPPDSPLGRSPSPTPVRPLARNHSYEGHSEGEEGPSSQLSQATERPIVRSGGEDEDGRTPRGKSKARNRDDSIPKTPKKDSDDELDALRSEFSPRDIPPTPPKLKPDPYSDWSPAKRKIMLHMRSKAPGEDVDVKRSLGEGMSKLDRWNAINELVEEGEIETVDGMNFRLADKGPKYPRF